LKVHELNTFKGIEYITKQMPENLKVVFVRKIIKKRDRDSSSKMDIITKIIEIYGADFIMPALRTSDRILVVEKISAKHPTQYLDQMPHMWIQYMKDV